jgi:hypothetical protein
LKHIASDHCNIFAEKIIVNKKRQFLTDEVSLACAVINVLLSNGCGNRYVYCSYAVTAEYVAVEISHGSGR